MTTMPIYCSTCGHKLKVTYKPLIFDPQDGKPLGKKELRDCINPLCDNKCHVEDILAGTGKLVFPVGYKGSDV